MRIKYIFTFKQKAIIIGITILVAEIIVSVIGSNFILIENDLSNWFTISIEISLGLFLAITIFIYSERHDKQLEKNSIGKITLYLQFAKSRLEEIDNAIKKISNDVITAQEQKKNIRINIDDVKWFFKKIEKADIERIYDQELVNEIIKVISHGRTYCDLNDFQDYTPTDSGIIKNIENLLNKIPQSKKN